MVVNEYLKCLKFSCYVTAQERDNFMIGALWKKDTDLIIEFRIITDTVTIIITEVIHNSQAM